MRCLTPFLLTAALGAQVDPETAAKIVEEGLQKSRVMAWQDYLCNNIGPRLTGSDNFTLACNWTKEQFADMGLPAELEQWAEWKLVWNRGQWTGRVLEPKPMELQVATPAWTAPTKGEARGPLHPMPNTTADIKKLEKAVKKAPVYLWGPRPPKSSSVYDELQQLIDQGSVLGIVQSATSTKLIDPRFANQIRVFGDRNMALREYDRRPTVPHIVVRDDQATEIEKRLKGRKKPIVEFEIRNRFRRGPIALHNVVAELRGTQQPEEVVVVCAHLDSWHQATGATDNGTGVCTTLEVARILTAVGAKPRRTIRFCLWGGEEQGLLGSRQYVVQHRSEMNRVSAVFNHDSGTNWAHSITVPEAMFADMKKVFAPVMKLKAPMKGYAGPVFALKKSKNMPQAGGGSDHASFAAAGVPAWPWGLEGERPYGYGWHSQWDTYSIVEPDYQAHTATVIALVALGVANLPHLLSREGVPRSKQEKGDATLLVEGALGLTLTGARVERVHAGGVAEAAGAKTGDVILALWGKAVANPVDMIRVMREHAKDKEIKLRVERAAETLDLATANPGVSK